MSAQTQVIIDALVKQFARARVARVGQDRSVTQRPRPRLCRSLEDRNNPVSRGDERHEVGDGLYSGSVRRIADANPGHIGGTLQNDEDIGHAGRATTIESVLEGRPETHPGGGGECVSCSYRYPGVVRHRRRP